jgi:hypothetical protein
MRMSECHPERQHLARGMCEPCYRATRRVEGNLKSQRWRDAHPERVREIQKRWRAAHPDRVRAAQKRWRVANPEKVLLNGRRHHLLKYGLTEAAYDEMLRAQQGLCAICRHPARGRRRLDVDHCHETGHVRGLLCSSCNGFLGVVETSPEALTNLQAYAARAAKLREVA